MCQHELCTYPINSNLLHFHNISHSQMPNTYICLERSLETGLVASKLALVLSPHSVGMYTFKLRSMINRHDQVPGHAGIRGCGALVALV